MVKIYKVKDKSEKHYVDKGDLFNLPMRLLIVGKSHLSGKTNLLTNLLLQDDSDLYRKEFKNGEDIFIFSGSLDTDKKIKTIIEEKDIPNSNLFNEFDDDILDAILDDIKDRYIENPTHSLIILDDMSFGGNLKKKTYGALGRLFSNGRHFGASVILTSQKYTDILSGARENCSGCILFKCTDKQLETISEEHNFLENRKDFKKMFRTVTTEPHSFLVVNYSNKPEKMYMNNEFKPIGPCGKVVGDGCNCKQDP